MAAYLRMHQMKFPTAHHANLAVVVVDFTNELLGIVVKTQLEEQFGQEKQLYYKDCKKGPVSLGCPVFKKSRLSWCEDTLK